MRIDKDDFIALMWYIGEKNKNHFLNEAKRMTGIYAATIIDVIHLRRVLYNEYVAKLIEIMKTSGYNVDHTIRLANINLDF